MTDSWCIDLDMSPLGAAARRRAASQTLLIPNEVLELADQPPPWPPESQRLFDVWSRMFSTDRITLNPSKEDALYSATYIARRVRRELAMVEMAFRLRRYEFIHGKLPGRLEELIEPSFPDLPTRWFEGKPFVYSTKGRAFTIEANSDVKVEVPLPNDEHRDAWGVLLKVDVTSMTPPKP